MPRAAACQHDQDDGIRAAPSVADGAPFRRVRWVIALFLVVGTLTVYAFWLFTGARPACQVTTAASGSVTKICGLPDVSDYIYVLAVVAVLLLPEAKSIKLGGLEFERLTTAVSEQAGEISRLSQQVALIACTTQNFSVTIAAGALASQAAHGDVPEGARPAEEVIDEFLDPGPA